MSCLNPYGAIKPDSRRFAEYLDVLRARWVARGVRPQRINGALALLREIERLRLCFSKPVEAAFASRKIANAALATSMGYKTDRQVQKLRQWLEEQGVLVVQRRKLNGFLNKWNSYLLADFRQWFICRYQRAQRKTGHPKEENDQRSSYGQKPKYGICFPSERLTTWETSARFWRLLAFEVTDSPPCLSALSDKFRLNLRRRQVPLDDPSIIARWKSFVRRAVAFQANREGAG
jgi:hypothetical protein